MKTFILPMIVLLPVVAEAAHVTVSVTPETVEKYGLDVEIKAVAQTVKEGDKPDRVTGHMYFITIKSGKLDLKQCYPSLLLENGKDSYLRAFLQRNPFGLEDDSIHCRVTFSPEYFEKAHIFLDDFRKGSSYSYKFKIKDFVSASEPTDPPGKGIPMANVPVVDLDGFGGISSGDLGGKTVRALIREEEIARIVVLRNGTSAPSGLHLARIGRILRDNPEIHSLWTVNERGARQRSPAFKGSVYFSALLVSKKNEYIGFHLCRDDEVRVVTKDGDGVIFPAKEANKRMDTNKLNQSEPRTGSVRDPE
ncbi:MAG TPA: hypothetical protein VMY42_29180 [Thermoguttaceae bacterium]|nr:hypothetical protein [Thermoguttaceae bacterium]